MKKSLVTLLLASLMACTLLGCGDVSGKAGADRGTSASEEKNKDKDKKKDKDKDKKKDKKKDKNNDIDNISYDKPIDSMNEFCENMAFVAMCLGEWDDNPDYVYEKEDFGKCFEDDDDANYINQMLLLRGLAESFGSGDTIEADNGAHYRHIADDETFAGYLKLTCGIEDFDFEAYDEADLAVSGLYHYDGNMYFFDNVFADMSVHYSYHYWDDHGFVTYVYSVSTEFEDGTPYDGTISVTVAGLDCMGWCDELIGVSFEEN